MQNVKLNFEKRDLVSTEYDPKTKKAGAATKYDLWFSTDYIDISNAYALLFDLAVHKYLYSVSYFDADKQFVSGEGQLSTSRCASMHALSVKPENAVYARFINFISGSETFRDASVQLLLSKEDCDLYLSQHPRTNFKIALLGDSLTEGDQGTKTAGVPSLNYRNYPFYLAQTLDCTVGNFGKCGYTASSYLWCYTSNGDVDIRDADLILVMLGTNEGLGSRSQQQSYRNLLKNIERDRKEGSKVVLVTPPHATEIVGKVNYGYNPNIISAGTYALDYAKKNGYAVIDAYAESPIQEENEDVYQLNDGLHMNSTGYQAFAEFIAEKLETMGLL